MLANLIHCFQLQYEARYTIFLRYNVLYGFEISGLKKFIAFVNLNKYNLLPSYEVSIIAFFKSFHFDLIYFIHSKEPLYIYNLKQNIVFFQKKLYSFMNQRTESYRPGAGNFAPSQVPRGPDFSQKGYYTAKNLLFAGRTWPAGHMLPPPDIDKSSSKNLIQN